MALFRPLTSAEIECRASQVTAKGVTLLLYKTARTDAALLDEVFGPMGWQNDFEFKSDRLYGGIGIYDTSTGAWVWKWDCGTESNMEAEKGQASDAFKRAGFKWGIGRELYTSPFIYVPAGKCQIVDDGKGKPKCYDRFSVTAVDYDENGKISALTIVNAKTGETVYSYPGKRAQAAEVRCERCGIELPLYQDENGKNVSPQKWAARSKEKYGAVLCLDCIRDEKIRRAENARQAR